VKKSILPISVGMMISNTIWDIADNNYLGAAIGAAAVMFGFLAIIQQRANES
jgi:hypothetical protein